MRILPEPIKRTFRALADRNLRFRAAFTRARALFAYDARYSLADRYLAGDGIEIGALHLPLVVPLRARVKYVDRFTVPELRAQYPELNRCPLVDPDIVDDGEKLGKIGPESQDFLIANHFLEHCQDPIRAIESFLHAVRPGGVVYMAVPDKRFTFDKDRELTPLSHLVRDYREGAACSREEHYRQWRGLVDEKFRNDPGRDPERLKNDGYSIHFHVWTYLEILELLAYLKKELGFAFEIEEFVCQGNEAIFILRKGKTVRE